MPSTSTGAIGPTDHPKNPKIMTIRSARLTVVRIRFDRDDVMLKVNFVGTKGVPIWRSPICLVEGSACFGLSKLLKVGPEVDVAWFPLPFRRLSVGVEKDGESIVRYVWQKKFGATGLSLISPFFGSVKV